MSLSLKAFRHPQSQSWWNQLLRYDLSLNLTVQPAATTVYRVESDFYAPRYRPSALSSESGT